VEGFGQASSNAGAAAGDEDSIAGHTHDTSPGRMKIKAVQVEK
jgi:hypothetical protein